MNLVVNELLIAYALSAAGMLLALLLMRADKRAYWRWPVYSTMAMALGVILWNLLRKHVFPPQWSQTHPAVLYYGVLAIYAVTGFVLGLFLGRLTRRGQVADDTVRQDDARDKSGSDHG
jgi:hypothetical protein